MGNASVDTHEINVAEAHQTSPRNQQVHHHTTTHNPAIDNAAAPTAILPFKFVFPILVTLVVFVCSVVAAIVALPLLMAFFLFTRLLQSFFGLNHEYDKSIKLKIIIKLKLVLRTWIYIDSAYLMCLLLVLYGVARSVPHLGFNYVKVLGFSLTYWIETYFVVFGICSMSYIVSIFMIRYVIFNIPLKYHTFQSGSHVVSDTVHETIDCFILLFLTEHELLKRTPILKQYRIIGHYPIHKLFYILILLLVFHNLIRLSIHIIVWQLHTLVTDPGNHPNSFRHLIATKFWGRESIVYWANGIKPSIMFVLTSLMLLLTWVFYLGPQLDNDHRPSRAQEVLDIGTWTFLSLFIFSFLWLIKTCILLLLEIRTVFNRFGRKISQGGKQLYFLGIIGRHNYDILKLRYNAKRKTSSQTPKGVCIPHTMENVLKLFGITKQDIQDFFTTKRGVSLIMLSLFPVLLIKDQARYRNPITDPDDNKWEKSKPEKSDEYYVKKLSAQRKNRVRDDLLMQEGNGTAMLYELQKMVHYFLEAKQSLSHENYTSNILQYLKDQADDTDYRPVDEEILVRLIAGENRHKTDGEPQQTSEASEEVTHDDWRSFLNIRHSDDLKTWMERARNHCVFLANTISSAKELVDCLDKFMSVLIIVVAFILWLLLTKLASTKAFVVIGSPILALSFIFGDAAKTFFQGIVFVYMVHPFDVGDLCVIDETMLEVVTIGVWKTTFSKVDTLEEVIYPNSDLANKDIINHRTELDWNDYVELYLGSIDSKEINKLRQKIEKTLKDDKYESTRSGVEVMTTSDNNIKIGVNIRYNTNLQTKNMSYFEYFWEKRKLRYEFVEKIVVEDEKDNEGPNIQGK